MNELEKAQKRIDELESCLEDQREPYIEMVSNEVKKVEAATKTLKEIRGMSSWQNVRKINSLIDETLRQIDD